MEIIQPVMLTIAGAFLATWPLYADSRWEWNGIPTEYVGYVVTPIGLIWLGLAIFQKLRGSPANPPR